MKYHKKKKKKKKQGLYDKPLSNNLIQQWINTDSNHNETPYTSIIYICMIHMYKIHARTFTWLWGWLRKPHSSGGYPGNASFPVYPWKPTQTPISPINKPFRIPGWSSRPVITMKRLYKVACKPRDPPLEQQQTRRNTSSRESYYCSY